MCGVPGKGLPGAVSLLLRAPGAGRAARCVCHRVPELLTNRLFSLRGLDKPHTAVSRASPRFAAYQVSSDSRQNPWDAECLQTPLCSHVVHRPGAAQQGTEPAHLPLSPLSSLACCIHKAAQVQKCKASQTRSRRQLGLHTNKAN